MKRTMKKTIGFLLSALLVLQFAPSFVLAVDDAIGLNYNIAIHVYDESGNPTIRVNKGDVVTIEVVVEQIGSGTAPLYALQGSLLFDSYILNYQSNEMGSGIQMNRQNEKLTFAFLDRTGEGVAIDNDFVVASLRFIAEHDGTAELSLQDFTLTNKDATTRNVDDTDLVVLTVGDGIRAGNKSALLNDIQKATDDLGKAIISEKAILIYHPAYWVTSKTAADFQTAIDAARAVYNNTEATTEQVKTAIDALYAAAVIFEENKTYGGYESYSWVQAVTVSAQAGEHGKISPKYILQKVNSNTSVSIISIPDDGYEVEYVYVNGIRFIGTELFTIPNVKNDTSVKVTFVRKIGFTDVVKDAWFYQSVRFAVSRGLFKGINETEFQPNAAMTRAMLVTVLHRLEGSPKSEASNRFDDVQSGQWYTDAVTWASDVGVITGYNEQTFGTNDIVTREQIVTILNRYAAYKKYKTDKVNNLSAYTDYAQVSSWAQQAMQWANAEGLVVGTTETTLSPKGNATRAQVAAILMRFIEKYIP